MKKITNYVSVLVLAFALTGCTTPQSESVKGAADTVVAQQEEVMAVDQLVMDDVVIGDGAEAVAGKVVTVHYTGTLTDGTKFDSSVDRGTPFDFTLGAGQVIKGWDVGVEGMKIGGKRKLTIPADMAYGDRSPSPLIPAGSTLVFDVELLGVAE